MTGLSFTLRMCALVLFGLMAGFFYAFSVTVMRGLDLVEPVIAIDAMNAINSAVRNPVFFVTFFVTPIVAVIAAISAMVQGKKLEGSIVGAAAVFYLLGVITLTAAVNVPMNEALALIAPGEAPDAAGLVWSQYSTRWTLWNNFRGVVAVGCMILVAWSLAPNMRRRTLR